MLTARLELINPHLGLTVIVFVMKLPLIELVNLLV